MNLLVHVSFVPFFVVFLNNGFLGGASKHLLFSPRPYSYLGEMESNLTNILHFKGVETTN